MEHEKAIQAIQEEQEKNAAIAEKISEKAEIIQLHRRLVFWQTIGVICGVPCIAFCLLLLYAIAKSL